MRPALDPVLELFPATRGSGCRAWIRTMNNASKALCYLWKSLGLDKYLTDCFLFR
jgi:hypothetical protein